MRISAQDELAADGNARNNGGQQARAGAVYQQLRMAYAIQLCVVFHDITQSAARAEKRIRSRDLCNIISGGILQKLPVTRFIKKPASPFMPRHVERHIVCRRILIQKIRNRILFHNGTYP